MITTLNMDCMAHMKDIPDKFYSLCIADPPYGINFDGTNGTTKIKSNKTKAPKSYKTHDFKGWDSERPSIDFFNELIRISKNQIIWGGNYFADLLPASRGWIFWDKKITNANNTNFSDGELAWTSFNCILRRFTYDWIGFGYLNNPQGEKKIHPTQTPVALYKWLLRNYAKLGDKIFDPMAGSFSSAIAAHDLGYDYVGIELDPDYYNAAMRRIRLHQEQYQLLSLDDSLCVESAKQGTFNL